MFWVQIHKKSQLPVALTATGIGQSYVAEVTALSARIFFLSWWALSESPSWVAGKIGSLEI